MEPTNLVMDVCTCNGDSRGRSDVESISVVTLVLAIASGVVNGNAGKSELLSIVDGEDLNRRVLDLNVLDVGVGHLVGVEELGLGLATVSTLAIPPSAALAIKDGARGTDDGDLVTRDRDKRTAPLLVSKGGGALESDGGASSQAGQIEGGSSRDNGAVDNDAGARLLLLENVGSGRGSRESTSATFLDGGSSEGNTAEKSGDGDSGEMNHGCFSEKNIVERESKECKDETGSRVGLV
jgi:hypothetical protein